MMGSSCPCTRCTGSSSGASRGVAASHRTPSPAPPPPVTSPLAASPPPPLMSLWSQASPPVFDLHICACATRQSPIISPPRCSCLFLTPPFIAPSRSNPRLPPMQQQPAVAIQPHTHSHPFSRPASSLVSPFHRSLIHPSLQPQQRKSARTHLRFAAAFLDAPHPVRDEEQRQRVCCSPGAHT